MKNILIFCLIAIQSPAIILSQTSDEALSGRWKSFIHIEGGFIYPEGGLKESLAIRQNISYYYVDHLSGGYISAYVTGLITGVRWELYNPRIKAGFSSGIRYTRYNSEVSGYTSRTSDFFYLRYSMEEGDTKFARVKSLTEINNLVSIPLELRYQPLTYKDAGFFAKAGIEFSILNFGNNTNIHFHDAAMEVHKDDVMEKVRVKPNKSYSVFYTSFGVNYGKQGKPNYMLEILLPSAFLSDNNFSLIDVKNFSGFKLSVNFPVN